MEVLVQAFLELKANHTKRNMIDVYVQYCNKGLITMPYRKYCHELAKLNTAYKIQQERTYNISNTSMIKIHSYHTEVNIETGKYSYIKEYRLFGLLIIRHTTIKDFKLNL